MLKFHPTPLPTESTPGGAVTHLTSAQELWFPLAASYSFIHLYAEFLYYPDKGTSLSLTIFILF